MGKNIDQVFIANPITSNASTDLMYFGQSPYGAGNDAAMTYANFSAQFGAPYTAAALTRTNDTNVTLTLGGAPATSLLQAVSLTLGWSGQLSLTRGGTNASLTASNGGIIYSTASALAVLAGIATANLPLLSGSSAAPSWGAFALSLGGALTTAGALTTVGAFGVTFTFTNTTSVTFPTSGTLATTSQLPTPAALTSGNDTNVTLTLGGTPATALLQASSITAGWSGTLAGSRGGLGAAITASNGGIYYSTASNGALLSGTATANQVLLSGSSTAPAWSTATYPATTTINQLLYSSSANTIAGITTGNNGLLVTSSAGVPSILAGPGTTGNILQSNAAAAPSFSTAAYPSVATTSGTILRANGTNWLASTATFADTYSVSTILYASSSNTVTGLATTNRAALSTNSTGVPTWLALTDGQVVIGSSAGSPAAATLTAGTGITVTNASNSITIASTVTGITNVNQNTSSVTLAANSRYATNNGASLVTYTIPAGAAVGDTYIIVGGSSGGWTIAQPASVACHVGSSITTTGVGGSISSSNQYDCCTITCVASNVFTVYGVQGNLTIV